ncbi:Hsp20/alpha crystallin family protein [Rhodopirellula sallentina]|nr:Hsp20/alpha crystallin family protein [Rhodopirellula sallentina]
MSTTMTTTNQNVSHDTERSKDTNGTAQRATYQPRFDIWEGDDELVLYGDLPGVDSDNLDVNFENRQLTIHGQVSHCHDEEGYLFSEYGVGDFQRTFTIGEAINGEAISAELHNGVLTLRLPKSEHAKPRRIEVQVR